MKFTKLTLLLAVAQAVVFGLQAEIHVEGVAKGAKVGRTSNVKVEKIKGGDDALEQLLNRLNMDINVVGIEEGANVGSVENLDVSGADFSVHPAQEDHEQQPEDQNDETTTIETTLVPEGAVVGDIEHVNVVGLQGPLPAGKNVKVSTSLIGKNARVGTIRNVNVVGANLAVHAHQHKEKVRKGSSNLILSSETATNKIFEIATNISDVEVSGDMHVIIRAGEAPMVSITAENDVNDVDVSLLENILILKRKAQVQKKSYVEVLITINHPLKRIDLNPASRLDYEDIATDTLSVDLNKASKCRLSGTVHDLNADVSKASSLDAKNLKAHTVVLDASDASYATIYAAKSLNVDASDASRIYYYGNPRNVVQDTSGMSRVQNAGKEL